MPDLRLQNAVIILESCYQVPSVLHNIVVLQNGFMHLPTTSKQDIYVYEKLSSLVHLV